MTRVTLLLARGPGKPEGDIADRLVMTLPLTAQGRIDSGLYDQSAHPWLALRDRNGGAPRQLEVIRIDEGWALQSTNSLDDPIWVFEGVVFRPGELVRVHRPDGQQLLYRIVATEPGEPQVRPIQN